MILTTPGVCTAGFLVVANNRITTDAEIQSGRKQ